MMKERILKWYVLGLWTEEMVLLAAQKGLLTHEEAVEITGEAAV